MMKTREVRKAKENPTRIFESPAEVLSADMPVAEKLAILENWENEAHQLQTAADESMTGGEPSRLSEIRGAIDKLKSAGIA